MPSDLGQQPNSQAVAATARSPFSLALRQGQAPVPLLHVPLDCDYVESRQGSGWKDPANWSAMLPLCRTAIYRAQLRARVLPSFRERFAALSGGSGVLPEAYVSFATGNVGYIDLATWALVAASEFSTRPTVLFVSAGKVANETEARFTAAKFPRLVAIEMPPPTLHPWFDKLRAGRYTGTPLKPSRFRLDPQKPLTPTGFPRGPRPATPNPPPCHRSLALAGRFRGPHH